ncbi:MNNG and nitrosoguanidine resistance protein [Biscogniauxia sp. FL1348]|nr:MNNG and nitrosoguanidine resistance protein [Biscogniauxia sp. FL1348]
MPRPLPQLRGFHPPPPPPSPPSPLSPRVDHHQHLPDASNLVIAARHDGSETILPETMQRAQNRGGSNDTLSPHIFGFEQARDYGHFVVAEKPHESVGFLHPSLNKARLDIAKQWGRILLTIMTFIIMVLSLYWAVLYGVEDNMRVLTVHVVDFDGLVAPYDNVTPIVGPLITNLTKEMYGSEGRSLGYVSLHPSDFDYDTMAVRRGVYNWDSWAAVIVNANATALLQEAAATGNASYDPTGAVQYIIQTARQETTFGNYINPQLQALSRQFAAQFGTLWAQTLMSNSSYDPDTLARAPAAVNPGVTPTTIDLRPFAPATATPAVSIGLIYLIIVAFFSFPFFLPIHMQYITDPRHPRLHFWQFVLWRYGTTVLAYFCVSLIYSLVPVAFQIPFWHAAGTATEPALNATAYGRGSFVVYWMVNFVGMNALGFACENMAMLLGQPWTAFWLIFWVITNVSTAFYSLDLAPRFFRWGYAWPLHHVVQASRQILFDLRSDIGFHFGILFAWIAVNTLLFPFCCYSMRWRAERAQRAAEAPKDRYTVKTLTGDVDVPKKEGMLPPIRKRGFMRGV